MIDWGAGTYEGAAAELDPVAEHVVALAELEPGERVVDLATGTGNAALRAAAAGAVVTGLDSALRLIEVGRDRAVREGLDASFVVGDLEELPFDDGSFDVALSVFGLIFAADPDQAFEEMVRVLRPRGRALVSAWVPAGAIDGMVSAFGRAMAAASGATPARRFAWHDSGEVGSLAARHDARVRVHEGVLEITAASPEAYLEADAQHPRRVASRPTLERAGTYDTALAQALAALRAGNEDPRGFRVSSPYRVLEFERLN